VRLRTVRPSPRGPGGGSTARRGLQLASGSTEGVWADPLRSTAGSWGSVRSPESAGIGTPWEYARSKGRMRGNRTGERIEMPWNMLHRPTRIRSGVRIPRWCGGLAHVDGLRTFEAGSLGFGVGPRPRRRSFPFVPPSPSFSLGRSPASIHPSQMGSPPTSFPNRGSSLGSRSFPWTNSPGPSRVPLPFRPLPLPRPRQIPRG